MPRLLSAVSEPIFAKIPTTRKPAQVGMHETTFPAPTVVIRQNEPIELTEAGIANVLERYGRQGMVEVIADEPHEVAYKRAKRLRAAFLTRKINHFRNHNAYLAAQQIPVLLPSERLRARMDELEALVRELDGALMAGGNPLGPMETSVDVAAEGLRKFGLPVGSAPLVPGVSPAMSGVNELA